MGHSSSKENAGHEEEDTVAGPAGPGLLDLLLVIAQRKMFILWMTLSGGIIFALVAFLLPMRFTATSVIVPPQQSQSMASALLGELGPLANLAGRDLGLKNPSDLYIGILGGRTIADSLIEKFQLREVYSVETTTDARKVLAKRSSFVAGKDSLIKIAVQDHDPKRAAELANAYVRELHEQTSRLALTESAQRRLFFEQKLEAAKESLADAEIELKSTQEKTGVLKVDSQVESIIHSMAQLRAAIVAREVALASLKSAATPQNPEVVRQESELASMRLQLTNLEANRGPQRQGDPLIPMSRLPEAGLTYVRALRNLKYHETLFELLAKQYEISRIDEAKDSPVIQVVDVAIPPERKSWPPRALISVAGAACFGLLACLLAFLQVRFQDPAEAEKLRSIRSAFWSR